MPSFRDVADLIGRDAAEALMNSFPGEKIYIPKKQVAKDFGTAEEYNRYIYQLCNENRMDFEAVSRQIHLSASRIRHIAAQEVRKKGKHMKADASEIFDSEYVYIGDDEKYHIRDDAPEDLKHRFKEFFDSLETERDDVITQE